MVGLLDRPPEVLCLILSFLGTLSVAAARLTCRALRDAATSTRRRVVIQMDGCYRATAPASPRVLQTMHTSQKRLDRLNEEERGAHVSLSTALATDQNMCQQFRRFLQSQLLWDLSPEVESLILEDGDLSREPPVKPHALLARMPRLERLHLFPDLDSETLHVLLALRRLTCLKMECMCLDKLQELTSAPSLSHLDAGLFDEDGEDSDFRQMLAILSAGTMMRMQSLGLPLPAAEARHLSRLSRLTALKLCLWDSMADLGGLASITGLQSLRVDTNDVPASFQSLSPVVALTGLTLLELSEDEEFATRETGLRSDVSALSSLAALRVLRLSFLAATEVLAGDPLPVQFRFLRTATVLEELELGLWGPFSMLPNASLRATREAVGGLKSLKKVSIRVKGSEVRGYLVPLHAFTAASCIESFEFQDHGPSFGQLLGYDTDIACGCFRALAKLRRLTLSVPCRAGPGSAYVSFPRMELLAGLPSNRLTYLSLDVDSAPLELTHQIAFRDLEVLKLRSHRVTSRFVDQLSALKCLTRLELIVWQQMHGAAVSAIRERAAQLKTAIYERARSVGVVGVSARMKIYRLGDVM